ncbi:MAG: hypothetical protein D6741_19230, partial [Planctomycetota bacterium]
MRRASATSSREYGSGRRDVVAGRPLLLWLSLAGLVPFFVLGALAETPHEKTPAPLPPTVAEPLPPLPPVDDEVGEVFISDAAESPVAEKELRVLPAPPDRDPSASAAEAPAARLALNLGESEEAASETTAWQAPNDLDRSPSRETNASAADAGELLPAVPLPQVGGEWVPAGTNRSDEDLPSGSDANR